MSGNLQKKNTTLSIMFIFRRIRKQPQTKKVVCICRYYKKTHLFVVARANHKTQPRKRPPPINLPVPERKNNT